MAEWLCSGLQIRQRRFDSDPSLQYSKRYPVAKRVGGKTGWALLNGPLSILCQEPQFDSRQVWELFVGKLFHHFKQSIHDVCHITR